MEAQTEKIQETSNRHFPGGQWLRICLPVQGTWVLPLVQEDPTCHGATKPQKTKPPSFRAHDPQQEKPQQSEACALQPECSPTGCNEKPAQQ